MPYRTLFPNATEKEWKLRNTDSEKKIKVVRLRDPDVDPEDLFGVDETPDDESLDSDEEESVGSSGILDASNQRHHHPITHQAYQCVEAAGPDGLKQKELGEKLGLSQLDARSVLRVLKRLDLVDCIVKDVRKNRVFVYVYFFHSFSLFNLFPIYISIIMIDSNDSIIILIQLTVELDNNRNVMLFECRKILSAVLKIFCWSLESLILLTIIQFKGEYLFNN